MKRILALVTISILLGSCEGMPGQPSFPVSGSITVTNLTGETMDVVSTRAAGSIAWGSNRPSKLKLYSDVWMRWEMPPGRYDLYFESLGAGRAWLIRDVEVKTGEATMTEIP